MFTQTWRAHWGLTDDPFACEDADKDGVLGRVDTSAVHSGFDRVFGDPRNPAPGIVFGEKGSGKSGLRLMMARRLAAHAEQHPDARVLTLEYVDFDAFLESLRRSLSGGRKSAEAREVLEAFRLSDHLDAILSLGVTALVDGLLDGSIKLQRPSPRQRDDLHLLTALYHRSNARSIEEARSRLSPLAGAPGRAPTLAGLCRVLLSLAGLGLAAAPHLLPRLLPTQDLAGLLQYASLFYGLGATVAVLPWIVANLADRRRAGRAASAAGALRVLGNPSAPVLHLLRRFPDGEAEPFLPQGQEEAARFQYLQRLLALLSGAGIQGLYVLVDRVDEPTLLADGGEAMHQFVAGLLDIKLLQHPGLALKLFLPIEMESIFRSASPQELKRMRLDKSNLVPELKWTGRELYEIANRRLLACVTSGSNLATLGDLFGDDLTLEHVLETFASLGTPRYAFGFLSEVLLQHVKEQPDDLPTGDARWRLCRAGFDVVRAGWIDRAGILRRTLN